MATPPKVWYNDPVGEKSFVKYVGLTGDKRLRFRITTRRGRVTELVVQLELKVGDAWKPVVRYDTAHGFPHRDTLDSKGNEIEKKSLSLSTLEEVLEYAEQDLTDRTDWYIERFLKTRGGK